MVLGEQHDVANGGDDETCYAEPVAVAEAVGQVCGDDGCDGCEDEDGDGADLGHGGGVAELFDDGGDEERACVSGVDDAWLTVVSCVLEVRLRGYVNIYQSRPLFLDRSWDQRRYVSQLACRDGS